MYNTSKYFSYIYADRNVRPCTIQGYTLATFPKVAQYILCTTREETGKRTLQDDKYPWLELDDIRRNMTDTEILQMKLNLTDSVLDEKGTEEFLTNIEQFTDIFSLRDEIGTCPFIEVHLKLKTKCHSL